MKIRYLFVDHHGQLVRIRRALVEALWRGEADAAELGCIDQCELRLVSVLCDDRLLPQKIYLLRLPLTQGRFTKENYLTLRIFSMPECVTPREVVQHHTGGWPADFFRQLAVAMDVTRKGLEVPVGIGGPLLMAAAMRTTPKRAVKFLR